MYFYETPVPLSRSIREFSRRLGKKWRIFEKNSRIFIKKLKDLDKKLKEFCPKLSNLATLSVGNSLVGGGCWKLAKKSLLSYLVSSKYAVPSFIYKPEESMTRWALEQNIRCDGEGPRCLASLHGVVDVANRGEVVDEQGDIQEAVS